MAGKPRIEVSDDALRRAVAKGGSWSDVAREATGVERPGGHTRARVRALAEDLGLDTSHVSLANRPGPKPKWTDADLVRHVPDATSWRCLGDLLGVTVGKTVRQRAGELGLDVSHLDAANHMAPPVIEPTQVTRSPAALRVAAESLAEAWYTLHGFHVFMPRAGSAGVDLLAQGHGESRRVQVKSTTHERGNGVWPLGVVCFQGEGRNTSRPYRDGEIDEVFAVTANGDLYVLPAEVVVGHRRIQLGPKYEKYKVAMFEPIDGV